MHMLAIVILPEDGEKDAEQWVEKLMAPGKEGWNGVETLGWWDWYRIGGRWDGVIQCQEEGRNCPLCELEGGWGSSRHHYSEDHAQVRNNIAKLRDVGEMGCYRVVCPDGLTMAREDYSRDDQDHLPFAERDYTVKEFPEFMARAFVMYREHYAVAVDYHS